MDDSSESAGVSSESAGAKDDIFNAAPMLTSMLIIITVITMVIIIERIWPQFAMLPSDNLASTIIKPTEAAVASVCIPYSMVIRSDVNQVTLDVAANKQFTNHQLIILQQVTIQEFYEHFLNRSENADYYSWLRARTSHLQYIPITEETSINLTRVVHGSQDRQFYPVVAVATDFIANALVCPIHTGDEGVPVSYIIAKFYRQPTGAFIRLMNLYSDCTSGGGECSVCLTAKPSAVVLPCRHKCVCLGCVTQLDTCPICRQNIISYFKTE